MPAGQTKGITVKIDAALHAEIKAYLEQKEMTMSEFIALAAQDELHPKIQQMEGQNVKENMRTMAFQVPESLFQRIKDYLARNHMTQKQFVIGLIEEELDRDEELLHKQNEQVMDDAEEELEEAPVEDEVLEFGPEDGLEESDPEQEEEQVVGDFENPSAEPTEEQDSAFLEGEVPEFYPEDSPEEPDPQQEEEQVVGDFEVPSDGPTEEQATAFFEDEVPEFGPENGFEEADSEQEEGQVMDGYDDSDEDEEEAEYMGMSM